MVTRMVLVQVRQAVQYLSVVHRNFTLCQMDKIIRFLT